MDAEIDSPMPTPQDHAFMMEEISHFAALLGKQNPGTVLTQQHWKDFMCHNCQHRGHLQGQCSDYLYNRHWNYHCVKCGLDGVRDSSQCACSVIDSTNF
jgi:hypothetical protein